MWSAANDIITLGIETSSFELRLLKAELQYSWCNMTEIKLLPYEWRLDKERDLQDILATLALNRPSALFIPWGKIYLLPDTLKVMGFPGGTSGKELICQCRRQKSGSIPGLGSFPGGGHSNPF